MYGPLILAAFKKAGIKARKSKKYPIAEYISLKLQEHYKVTIGEKMLVNYYDEAVENIKTPLELRSDVEQALCQFLGYKDFEDFDKNYSQTTLTISDKAKNIWDNFVGYALKNWHGLVIIVIVLAILNSTGLTRPEPAHSVKRFMVWKENHYEEVPYEKLKEYSAEELIDFREDLIRDFKKILSPDCRTEYFDAKGRPLVWYGKNASGELEYFTALAVHPETRKSLDEITRYMIKNHICDTY